MEFEKVADLKVACHVSRRDLKENGITVDDLVNRTPLGMMFIRNSAKAAKAGVDCDWPGCAFSTQMEFYPDDIVIFYSERIDDYLAGIRQMALALPKEEAENMNRIVEMIAMSEEEIARNFIREFEQNVRNVQE